MILLIKIPLLLLLLFTLSTCENLDNNASNDYEISIEIEEGYFQRDQIGTTWAFLSDADGKTRDIIRILDDTKVYLGTETSEGQNTFDLSLISYEESFFVDKETSERGYRVNINTYNNFPNEGELHLDKRYLFTPTKPNARHFSVQLTNPDDIDTVIIVNTLGKLLSKIKLDTAINLNIREENYFNFFLKNKSESFLRYADIDLSDNKDLYLYNSFDLDTAVIHGPITLPKITSWRTSVLGHLEGRSELFQLPIFYDKEWPEGPGSFTLWYPKNYNFTKYSFYVRDVSGSKDQLYYRATIDALPSEIPTTKYEIINQHFSSEEFSINLSETLDQYHVTAWGKRDPDSKTIITWTVISDFKDGIAYTFPEIPEEINILSRRRPPQLKIYPSRLSIKGIEFCSPMSYEDYIFNFIKSKEKDTFQGQIGIKERLKSP